MNQNEELNKLDVHKDRVCVHCGRAYPETILNIEGFLHHQQPIQCVDTKSCRRIARRAKKR